ncbi:MAG: hypothetical protein ACRDKI_02865 [Solirubrobacterales bacterium]
MRRNKDNPQNHIHDSEIASFADGSLPANRRRELEDRIHESETAREAIAQQQRVVDIVRGAQVDAPASLHAAVAELAASSAEPPRRARTRIAFAVGSMAAAALIVLVLMVDSGTPKIDRAAQLAAAGPVLPAPKESRRDERWLDAKVDDVAFPYWEDERGWKSYGARDDSFEGAPAKTVYYRDDSRREVAYTIVGGQALDPGGTAHVSDDGITYRVSATGGTRRVVWQRGGHTCILTARDVDTDELQTLVD